LKLQHDFEVSASPAETLALLLDPERVVECMPGAVLVEVTDDGVWKTTMSVKLGPVGMDFLNDVRIVEQAPSGEHVRLAVTGRDKRGKGGADAEVDATLAPGADGGTRVAMVTDVHFSGQAAQLGRPSVIQDISRRLVGDFADCIGRKLAAPVTSPAATAGEAATPAAPPALNALALLFAAARDAVVRRIHPRSHPG
jgi:carbon monoxide dehydrogenase subunit G